MIKITLSLFLLCAISSSYAEEGGCHEPPQVCLVNGTETEYDCNEICCGGQIYDKSDKYACCGNEENGGLWYYGSQICCSPWYTEEYAVYDNTNNGEQCCGLEMITNDMRNEYSCCNGWKQITLFKYRTEMCCGGAAFEVGDTQYGQCCGDVGFDRRNQSCPCGRPPVADVPNNDAQCCRSRDGTVMGYTTEGQACCNGVAYDTATQFCCNDEIGDATVDGDGCCGGVVFDTSTEICCNNEVGNASTDVCCNNQMVALNPDSSGAGTGCCEIADGSMVQYDSDKQACCNGELTDLPEGERGLCCGGVLSLTPSDGDSCCVNEEGIGQVFSSNGSVCCSGETGFGDSCCAGSPYFHGEQTCCGGENATVWDNEGMFQPSCCVDEVFDAVTQTCCGSTVHENPLIANSEGIVNETSSHTRCCGNHALPDTLQPYDYFHSMCCGGLIYNVGIDGVEALSCCGNATYDSVFQFCCYDAVYKTADYLLEDGNNVNCHAIFNPEPVEPIAEIAEVAVEVETDGAVQPGFEGFERK